MTMGKGILLLAFLHSVVFTVLFYCNANITQYYKYNINEHSSLIISIILSLAIIATNECDVIIT